MSTSSVPAVDRKPSVRTPGPAGVTSRPDAMAVASFVLGLVGLLVLNVVLGPIAVALACLALRGGTSRRGRAFLGLGLGVADLVVLAALTAANGTVAWNLG
ncbi:DUF4190 domain-containing protein [Streptomyces sp. Da 82-17]|uniref:DUF4190 domain-containing protein n=1 Tax=Streptomyces sp. Da 82-17 TaxID=3377116 RepID=UPI0038D3AE09